MPYIPTQRRFEDLEDFPGPQRPLRALVGVLFAGMMTETDQNAYTTDGARVNYAYMDSPQRYRNVMNFNTPIPVIAEDAATPPARHTAARNTIEDIAP